MTKNKKDSKTFHYVSKNEQSYLAISYLMKYDLIPQDHPNYELYKMSYLMWNPHLMPEEMKNKELPEKEFPNFDFFSEDEDLR